MDRFLESIASHKLYCSVFKISRTDGESDRDTFQFIIGELEAGATILGIVILDSARLEEVFSGWARETFGGQVEERDVLAIDGKTIRRARYKNNRAPHIVSAFASRLEIGRAHV